MFWRLIGVGWKPRTLGQFHYRCSRCGKLTFHNAVVLRKSFTLFFIPLLPLGKDYEIVCNLCGLGSKPMATLQDQLRNLERTGQFSAA
jgi:ribosomal protein L37E